MLNDDRRAALADEQDIVANEQDIDSTIRLRWRELELITLNRS